MRIHPTASRRTDDSILRVLARAGWLHPAPIPPAEPPFTILHRANHDRHAPATRHYRR